MPTAFDVAAYIIARRPEDLTTMKLQKLLYYSQAWSLAWDGEPLFADPIRAWDRGPVVGAVFDTYRGHRRVRAALAGDPTALSASGRATVDAVLGFYGAIDGDTLSELTHLERPWRDAFARRVRPSPVIDHAALRAFYRPEAAPPKEFPDAFRRGVELVLSLSPEDLEALADDSIEPVSAEEIARWSA